MRLSSLVGLLWIAGREVSSVALSLWMVEACLSVLAVALLLLVVLLLDVLDAILSFLTSLAELALSVSLRSVTLV